LIENKANYGFAAGNNIGISHAVGRYIVLLNNDTRADPDFLKHLVRVAEQHPRVGMCAAKVYLDSGERIIDTVGHLIYRDGLNRGRGRLELDMGQYDETEEVLFPSGSAALYKKEMLDEIGLFDEDFFAYGDDTDIGLKARLAGWQCLFVPQAIVYHKYSGSTSAYSPLKAFLVERNRIWIAIKYFPLPLLVLNPYYAFTRYAFQAYGALTYRGAAGLFAQQYSHVKLFSILFRAHIAAIKEFPKMWHKRKQIKRDTAVSKREIYAWFEKFGIGVKELALKD
ncbi:MAG: glycosyltransferase family 2 protein, partial [Deltaproteobacteria bacterium]|nr:glycosyltransferase family 2 protein [Deltaproteobacteria bacterium]